MEAFLSLLLRFLPFEERRWLLNPLFLFIFPVAVTLNLLTAPRLLLILGTVFSFQKVVSCWFFTNNQKLKTDLLCLLWGKEHSHVPSLQPRRDIELGNIFDLREYPL